MSDAGEAPLSKTSGSSTVTELGPGFSVESQHRTFRVLHVTKDELEQYRSTGRYSDAFLALGVAGISYAGSAQVALTSAPELNDVVRASLSAGRMWTAIAGGVFLVFYGLNVRKQGQQPAAWEVAREQESEES